VTAATKSPPSSRGIDPRIRQRRISVQRSKGRRRLRRILIVVAIVAIAVLAWVVLHTAWFSARVIKVDGAHPHTTEAAIVAASGLDSHPALVTLDGGSVASQVERLPYIATASVVTHWPDAVTITVTERVPAAQVAGTAHSYSVIDDRGRTLAVSAGHVSGLRSLTVLTAHGPLQPVPVGQTLPAVADGGLQVVRTLPLAFATQVNLVTVQGDGTVTLLLGSGITVLLGSPTDLRAKYEDVASIIAHGTLHPTSVIDVTVPQSPTVSG
jgi:cell division protein FtsQ